MRVLITGASGFVGRKLADYLAVAAPDTEIHGTTLGDPREEDNCMLHHLDLRDEMGVHKLIQEIRPGAIYHLAAQAFVPRSFEDPWETLENNIRGQVNIITGCLEANHRPRILVVGSAEIYGVVTPDELPLTEQSPMRPFSPYSVSKIAQDMLALQYYMSHDLSIMRARSFNHIGPGQNERFVAPAFAAQVARIEAGTQDPVIAVGDLRAKRDFTDVRDIVRAYYLIIERGIPGDVYNVASGEVHSIQALLDYLLTLTDADIRVEVDPERLRPVTLPILQGSCEHLHAATGWRPEISFEQSLSDILDEWRGRIRET